MMFLKVFFFSSGASKVVIEWFRVKALSCVLVTIRKVILKTSNFSFSPNVFLFSNKGYLHVNDLNFDQSKFFPIVKERGKLIWATVELSFANACVLVQA